MLGLALVLALTQTPQHRLARQPNLTRLPAFSLAESLAFGESPQLPTCTGDSSCVMQCRVKPDGSAGACYDNTGAEMTGFTDGVGAGFAPTYIAGTFAWQDLDDSASATAVPRISHASVRSAFTGDHTVVFHGYATTQANANGGWYAMITDGTNQLQARRGSGNLECLEQGSGGTVTDTATLALDGFAVWSCTRTSGTLKARAHGVEGAGVSSTMGAVTGTPSFYIWGGTGGCCTPGGTAAGQLVSLTLYNAAKSTAWHVATEKAAFGAQAVMSGPLGAIGTVGTTPFGRDDVPDSGVVWMFRAGAYVTDPTLGIHAQNAFQNFWAADPLAAAGWTDVATPTITSNASAGPWFLWKNINECDLIEDNDGTNFEGKRSTSSAHTAGGSWYNASCYLKAGTSGTTTTAARIRLNTDGTVDAGTLDCDVTGLTSTARRYPLHEGCWAWIDNPTSVTADVLVGNAGAETGSITTCQCQLTRSLFPETPTVDGTAKGANYPLLDGGAIPYGNGKGKVEAVFQIPYATSQYGATQLISKAVGTYIFDAYNEDFSHTVLTWASAESNEPSFHGLLYGEAGTDENRFNVHPISFVARSFYVAAYEWRPSGSGCLGKMRLDTCADPATCVATTVIGSSTTVGECPIVSHIVDLGTREAGSSPSSIWVRKLRVYR